MWHDERTRETKKGADDSPRTHHDASVPNDGDREPIRILLADGNDDVRRGLIIALATTDDLQVVGDVATGDQVLRACARFWPDVVLMEIHLTDHDGIELIQQLLGRFPHIHVVVLTGDTSPTMRGRVLSAGAHAILHKYVTSDELIAAIRTTRVT